MDFSKLADKAKALVAKRGDPTAGTEARHPAGPHAPDPTGGTEAREPAAPHAPDPTAPGGDRGRGVSSTDPPGREGGA